MSDGECCWLIVSMGIPTLKAIHPKPCTLNVFVLGFQKFRASGLDVCATGHSGKNVLGEEFSLKREAVPDGP